MLSGVYPNYLERGVKRRLGTNKLSGIQLTITPAKHK